MAMAQTAGVRILIVDDEPSVCHLVRRILSVEGAEILEARSGKDALRLARTCPVDLLVVDVRLPDLSGLEVLRRVRRIDPTVPVIMLSGHGSRESVRTSMSLGAFDYLTKPLNHEELRRLAHEALSTRASHRLVSWEA